MPRVHGIDISRRRRNVSFTDGTIHGNVGKLAILSKNLLQIESSADANAVSGTEEAAATYSSLGNVAKSSLFSPSWQMVKDANFGNSNDEAHDRRLDAITRVNVLSDCSNCNSSTVTTSCSNNVVKVSSATKIVPLSKGALEHIEFSSKSFSVPVLTSKDADNEKNGEMAGSDTGFIGIAPSLDQQQVTVSKERMMDGIISGNCHDDDMQCCEEGSDKFHGVGLGNAKMNETLSTQKNNSSDAAASKEEAVAPSHTEVNETVACRKSLSEIEKDAKEVFATKKRSCQVNPHALWLYNRCSTALSAMQTDDSPLDLGLKILNVLNKNNSIDKAHESQEDLSKLQHILFVSIGGGKRRDLNLVFDVCERREVLREYEMKKSLIEVANMKEFEIDCTNDADGGDGEEKVYDSNGVNASASTDSTGKTPYDDGISTELTSMTVTTSHKIEANNPPIKDGAKRNGYLNAEVDEVNQNRVRSGDENDFNSTEVNSRVNISNPPMDDETDRPINLKRTPPIYEHHENILQNVQSASKKDAVVDIRADTPIQPHKYAEQQTEVSLAKKPRSRHKKRSSFKFNVDFNPTGNKDDIGVVDSRSTESSSSKHASPLKGDDNTMIPGELPIPNHGLDVHDNIEWSFVRSDIQVAQEEDAPPPSRRVTRSMGSVAFLESEKNSKIMREKLEKHGVDSPPLHSSINPRDENGDVIHLAAPNDVILTLDEDPVQELKFEVATKQNTRCSAGKYRGTEASSSKSEERDEDESNCSLAIHGKARRKRSDKSGPVRVMFTGFNPTQLHKQMIRSIGAELVENIEDAVTATHIIVSDGNTPLRRTPKLMICISKVSKILNIKWLEESFRQQQLLDTKDFLHLDDTEAETRYSFSMRETIRHGINVRHERGGVLGGRWIYICRGVAGKQAPSTKDLHLIIEAAGGTVLRSLCSSHNYDPINTIIITSDPRTQSQLNENGIGKQIANGAKTCTTSWLFHTIITQKFSGIDDRRNAEPCDIVSSKIDNRHFSRLVRCESHESLVSALSVSPVKQSGRSALGRKTAATNASDVSIFSMSSRGSKVSHLEYAQSTSQSKRLRKEIEANGAPKQAPEHCKHFLSRDKFLSSFLPLSKPISSTEDKAAIQVRMLWTAYFNKIGGGDTTPKVLKVTKGVRCRRGRNRTLSPLVTCTLTTPAPVISEATPRSEKNTRPTPQYQAPASKSPPENPEYVSWEAYVLFTIRDRAATLEKSRDTTPLIDKQAIHTFPMPVAIDYSTNKLSLIVETKHGCSKIQESSRQEVFGTLQDVFDLHCKYQTSGPFPESVIANLTVLAIQAVSTMHACGVVHNDISLNSFLVVRASPCESKEESSRDHGSHWHLQIIGFGHKSLVLNCQKLTVDNFCCQDGHFEQDYKGLANVVHILITGGMAITLTEVFGRVEFASKFFLKGNLFLRGALSWCALIDALMGVSNDFGLQPIQLQYPFDVFDVEPADRYPICRKNQISWACRMLHEISSSNISLYTFLEGLLQYNSRFILPNISHSTFACYCCNTQQSFLLCPSFVETSMFLQSTVSHKDANQLQVRLVEQETRLTAEVHLLARREANYHNEISEIHKRIEENKTLFESNLEIERRIRQKETELLRKEEEIVMKEARIREIKEGLLSRERLLERQMQQLANTNHFKSLPSHKSTLHSPPSPCHSIQAQSSVCSSELKQHCTSLGSSDGNKSRKRDGCKSSIIKQQNSKAIFSKSDHTPPTRRRSSRHSPVPRPAEHLCSLQNLGSPSMKIGRATSDVHVNIRMKLNCSPDNSLERQKRTPKRVFIDIDD